MCEKSGYFEDPIQKEDGTIVVPTKDENYKINILNPRKGTKLWKESVDIGTGVATFFTYHKGTLYIQKNITGRNALYAIDINSGKVKWTRNFMEMSTAVISQIVPTKDGSLFVVGNEKIVSLDTSRNKVKAEYYLPEDTRSSIVFSKDENFMYVVGQGTLNCFKVVKKRGLFGPKKSTPMWSINFENTKPDNISIIPDNPSMVLSAKKLDSDYKEISTLPDGTLLIGNSGKAVIEAFDPVTRKSKWRLIGSGKFLTFPPTRDKDGRLYFVDNGTEEATVVCVDEKSGKILWKQKPSKDLDKKKFLQPEPSVHEPPILDEEAGILYVSDTSKGIFALDKATGKIKGRLLGPEGGSKLKCGFSFLRFVKSSKHFIGVDIQGKVHLIKPFVNTLDVLFEKDDSPDTKAESAEKSEKTENLTIKKKSSFVHIGKIKLKVREKNKSVQ